MILPSLRKIFKADFKPEFHELIETMLPTVNNGVEVLYEALNGKVSISDNLVGVVRDVDLSVNAQGIPVSSSVFTLNSSDRILGISVIKTENLTNSSIYLTSAPFLTYSQVENRIIINHITGLVAGNNYRIRVKTWG